MIIRPYGDTALLVEFTGPSTVLGLRDALSDIDGVDELVPAARTLLVRFDPRHTSPAALSDSIARAEHHPVQVAVGPTVELAVHYDGEDLAAVADAIACSIPALIERHAAGLYTVAFCGFAPGFAYLSGLDPALHVPRLSSPRTSVPAGSVAVAGEYTGVYPHTSPGGWRLLGRTDARLWDIDRTPPALLTPGTSVRFRPTASL